MNKKNMSQANNWDKLKSKVEGFRPDEYSPADWKEMEALLDSAAPIRPKRGVLWALKLRSWRGWAVPFAAVLATASFFVVQNARFDEPQLDPASTATEQAQPKAKTEQPVLSATAVSPEPGTGAAGAARVLPGDANLPTVGIDGENKTAKPLQQPAFSKQPASLGSQALEGKKMGALGTAGTGPAPHRAGPETGLPTAAASAPALLPTAPAAEGEEVVLEETAARKGTPAAVEMPVLPEFTGVGAAPAYQVPPPATTPIRRALGNKKARFGMLLGVNNSVTDYQDFTRSHYPFVGLFATKRLSERWEAQLEGHLKTVDKYDLSQSFTEYEIQRNKTLSTTTRTVFYQRYDAVEFPMSLKYTFRNRLGLIGGVRPSFIAANRGNHSFVFFREKDNNGLPFRGFWNLDIGLIAGMEYYVTPRWIMDLRWNQGLRDLTPDNLYQSDAVHLNSDLQFSVRYILF